MKTFLKTNCMSMFTSAPFFYHLSLSLPRLRPLPVFSFKLMAPQGGKGSSAQDIIGFLDVLSSLPHSLSITLAIHVFLLQLFPLSFLVLPAPDVPPPSPVLRMKMLTVGTGSSWPLSTTASESREHCVSVFMLRLKQ